MHKQIAVVALAAAALAACSPDHGGMGPRGAAAQAVKLEAGATSAVATDDTPGSVYTLMNLTATAGGGGTRSRCSPARRPARPAPRAQSPPAQRGRAAPWALAARRRLR